MLRLQSPEGKRAGGASAKSVCYRTSMVSINGPIFEDGIFVVVGSLLVPAPRELKVFPSNVIVSGDAF